MYLKSCPLETFYTDYIQSNWILLDAQYIGAGIGIDRPGTYRTPYPIHSIIWENRVARGWWIKCVAAGMAGAKWFDHRKLVSNVGTTRDIRSWRNFWSDSSRSRSFIYVWWMWMNHLDSCMSCAMGELFKFSYTTMCKSCHIQFENVLCSKWLRDDAAAVESHPLRHRAATSFVHRNSIWNYAKCKIHL